MSHDKNPSGLPGRPDRVPKNRLSLGLDRRPTAATAAGGFATYMLGAALLMISVLLIIAGVTMLIGGMWGTWQGRAAGALFVLGGAVLFGGGKWLFEQFTIQRRH